MTQSSLVTRRGVRRIHSCPVSSRICPRLEAGGPGAPTKSSESNDRL